MRSAEIMLQQAEKLGCRSFITPEDVVYGVQGVADSNFRGSPRRKILRKLRKSRKLRKNTEILAKNSKNYAKIMTFQGKIAEITEK